MFLEFYGLREQPFGVTADPRFLYLSTGHREALASLIYGIEAGLGFSTLIAEPGMGKTTLLNRILSHFRSSARTAFIFETQCDSREFRRSLQLELEITGFEDNEDNVAFLNRLKYYLLDQARSRRRVLLVVDEAQNLDDTVLETIRLLSNFETYRMKLLHIILAGQPQLATKISRPEMVQLRQRINQANRLRPLQPEDTVKYIAHRLRLAGYSGDNLFSPEALAGIVSWSRGVPREINRLCFNSMSLGCALQRREIDADIMQEVRADLAFDGETPATPAPQSLDVSGFELAAQFRSALAARSHSSGSTAAPPARQSSGTTYEHVSARHPQERSFWHVLARRTARPRADGEGLTHRGAMPGPTWRRRPSEHWHAQSEVSGTASGKAAAVGCKPPSTCAKPAGPPKTRVGCFELNRKPQPAIIVSLSISALLGCWLLVASGKDESVRHDSTMSNLLNSPSASSQPGQTVSDLKNDRVLHRDGATRQRRRLQKSKARANTY